MSDSIFDFRKSSSRNWRKEFAWPAFWVLTVFILCKGFVFRGSEAVAPTSAVEEEVKTHNITQPSNRKYYSTESTLLDLSHPALNPTIFLNVSTSPKVAVIIETRAPGYLVPLILHFSSVLGPSWPILIYTEAENYGRFTTSSSFLRLSATGRINVRPLPEGLYFPNWASVSAFFKEPWLWEDLAPAENILFFQADSILCSNSVRSVDDFLQYDFIGAPIVPRYGQGYNGGLSLRKRETFLRVVEEFKNAKAVRPHPEDQWFYARMMDIKKKEHRSGLGETLNLPSMEIARTFAVETIDYPSPLGFHQPTRFIKKHMVDIDNYCPEYKLATKTRIRG